MFSREPDASKFALKTLSEMLVSKAYHLIDCQLESTHLLSLGAQTIPRTKFIKQMNQALQFKEKFCHWQGLDSKAS